MKASPQAITWRLREIVSPCLPDSIAKPPPKDVSDAILADWTVHRP